MLLKLVLWLRKVFAVRNVLNLNSDPRRSCREQIFVRMSDNFPHRRDPRLQQREQRAVKRMSRQIATIWEGIDFDSALVVQNQRYSYKFCIGIVSK